MLYRKLGSSGIEASVIGQGTWVTGGWMWGGSDEAESIRAIHAALDSGVNLIDTAPIYGHGHSEEIVGRALKGRRDDAIVATKCTLVWNENRKIYFSLKADSVRQECEDSLRRLDVDERGLDAMDRRFLVCIAESYGGGPGGVETLSAALSEQKDVIEEVIEPYLIQQGLLQRTSRGRVLALAGYGYLGLQAPREASQLPLLDGNGEGEDQP